MFDCVMPTRNGRNAYAFTAGGRDPPAQRQYTRDTGPDRGRLRLLRLPDISRAGRSGTIFSRARCLARSSFPLHNIRFYQRLMADVRGAIARRDVRAVSGEPTRGAALGPQEVQQAETHRDVEATPATP